MAWLYLPDMEGSSLESTPPSEAVEPWVTLSGKATQRPLSWRGWQNRPYIQLLSGMTLPPSTAARGVESWISSLRASHANRSAWQEPDEAKATSAGSGTISSESFAKFSPDGSLVRTSLDLFLSDSTPYCDRLPASGMMLAGELFELTRWEPPIDESESSSSQDWGTPEAHERTFTPRNMRCDRKIVLANQVSSWPTPQARDEKNASSIDDPRMQRKMTQGWSPNLNESGVNWPTITASEGDKNAGRRNPSDRVLNQEAKNWPTPMAADNGHKVTANTHQAGLIGATQSWATPRSSDSETPSMSRKQDKIQLREETIRSSPLALQISTCGPDCSPSHRRLNPHFVEWLMGLPSGWTIAKTGFGPAATELYHYKQQLRYECLRLAQVGS